MDADFGLQSMSEKGTEPTMTATMPPGVAGQGGYWREITAVVVVFLASLLVGLLAPQVMIGDEITHYYMLVTQATDLSNPNIEAYIPVGDGTSELRHYPHVFLWHYLGAVLCKIAGSCSVELVQVYQALFWVQYLVAGFLLARHESRARIPSFLYLLLIASLPVSLLLSVAFYQDVPALAQILTSFLLLRRRQFALSLLFLVAGLSMKETAFVMLPVYVGVAVVTYRPWNEVKGWLKFAGMMSLFSVVVLVTCLIWMGAFESVGANFYPMHQARKYFSKVVPLKPSPVVTPVSESSRTKEPEDQQPRKVRREILSHHPGDLRQPVNFLVFGGGIMWLALLGAAVVVVLRRAGASSETLRGVSWWALGAGLLQLMITGIHMKNSPDARFFLPGVVFILLPVAQMLSLKRWNNAWLATFAVAAVLQSGAVLVKTYQLRHVSSGITEAIEFLRQNPPPHNRIFMYPEGNYRLFPCAHDWYMKYALKDFWRGDQDTRIKMLHERKIGAVAIKKHLVGKIDPKMTNLGVYPVEFVADIEKDQRFKKVFDNSAMSIYLVPALLLPDEQDKQ